MSDSCTGRRSRLSYGGTTFVLLTLLTCGCGGREQRPGESPQPLSHEQTLQWIQEHHAWRLARKAKAIRVRPVEPEDVGKEFQTADHVAERAREGFWLCVGVAGEPWFQAPEKVAGKYEKVAEEDQQYAFDSRPRKYQVYKPKGDVLNWAAQITAPDVSGFFIRPNYDPGRPLYSPAGGYVVKDYAPDPNQSDPNDVWLVQQALFDSTYEWAPDDK